MSKPSFYASKSTSVKFLTKTRAIYLFPDWFYDFLRSGVLKIRPFTSQKFSFKIKLSICENLKIDVVASSIITKTIIEQLVLRLQEYSYYFYW